MRFYRLEKTNYFKIWACAIFKAIALALIATVAIMLIAGYKFMIVSSGSMEPTLPVGSLVIVTPCEYEDLEYGDIVTMDAGGINLTHRIVGKYNASNPNSYLVPGDEGYEEEYYWVTKGDNSDTLDGKLTKNIVGKVYDSHAFSWVGLIVRYVRANYTMLIVLLIILAVFISVLEWLKNKMTPDDIECYDLEEEE
ncbi:MAG: signal peptidase I [Christensenellales bacterium]